MAMKHFNGRELSGVVMQIDGGSKGERQRVRFGAATTTSPLSLRIMDDVFDAPLKHPQPAKPHACMEGVEKQFKEKKRKKRELKETVLERQGGVSTVAEVSIATADDLPSIASAISAAGTVALDIETFGPRRMDALNPWRGDIRLLSLKVPGQEPWLIDLQASGYDLGPLAGALESVEVIAHNAKFDLLWLARKCEVRPSRVFCTLTAARLLSAGTKHGNNLDQCLHRYLGLPAGTDHAGSDWGGMLLTAEQLAYAVRDVTHLHDLRDKLVQEIGTAGLEEVCAMEMALCPVVVAMEEAGIAVDATALREMRDAAQARASAEAAAVREMLASPALNPASADQLRNALNRFGITVPNTSEAVLKSADDGKVIPAILAMRSAEKVAQQADTLLACIESDGRIHGRFEPTGTETGRFASKSPNLQNIGRGELRDCFMAPPGRVLVVADYSQVELRAAAAIAGESRMLEAYRAGADLHRRTAAVVLDKAEEEVTPDDRQLAKAVNFGLLYGQSAKGLVRYAASAYGVALSENAAQEIRSAFFRGYSGLRQWHGESRIAAERGITEVRTRMGRRRIVGPGADEWERFTALVNTPVQGGCADGMKRALLLLAARLPGNAALVSTVHDEVIVECDHGEAPEIRRVVEAAMTEAMAGIFPEVPIAVEAKVCGRWGGK